MNNNGFVGIGTSAPTHNLNVNGSVNITDDFIVNGYTFYVNSTSNRVAINTSNPQAMLHISNASQYALLITNSSNVVPVFVVNATNGRVGIGTSTPTHTLNVVGQTNITQNLTVGPNILQVDTSAKSVGINIREAGHNISGTGISFYNSGSLTSFHVNTTHIEFTSSAPQIIYGDDNFPDIQQRLLLQDWADGKLTIGGYTTLLQDRTNSLFVLDTTGNGTVGIHTSTPDSALTVNGNVSINNTFFVNNNGNVNTSGDFLVDSYTFYVNSISNRVAINTSNPQAMLHISNASQYALLITNSSNVVPIFVVNATNGRVGIGTTTPTHILNVVGDQNITGVIHGMVDWATALTGTSGTDNCDFFDSIVTGWSYTCLDCVSAVGGASDCSSTTGNRNCACTVD